MWAIQWRLLDAVSCKCSLSVLLSAIWTSRTTRTALVLAQWLSSETICIRVLVPQTAAAATIWRWRLFHSELLIVRLLFEGGDSSKNYSTLFQLCYIWVQHNKLAKGRFQLNATRNQNFFVTVLQTFGLNTSARMKVKVSNKFSSFKLSTENLYHLGGVTEMASFPGSLLLLPSPNSPRREQRAWERGYHWKPKVASLPGSLPLPKEGVWEWWYHWKIKRVTMWHGSLTLTSRSASCFVLCILVGRHLHQGSRSEYSPVVCVCQCVHVQVCVFMCACGLACGGLEWLYGCLTMYIVTVGMWVYVSQIVHIS